MPAFAIEVRELVKSFRRRGTALIAYANPITWHVDVLRFATIGAGRGGVIAVEGAAFAAFMLAAFACALWVLQHQE
jgi:ABC-type multidrug transport system permease subunit